MCIRDRHNGREETTTFCLIPAVREATTLPLIAAGGVGTGEDVYKRQEEQYARFRKHLTEKYAEGGYLKLWIPQSDNAGRLAELRNLITNEDVYKRQGIRRVGRNPYYGNSGSGGSI